MRATLRYVFLDFLRSHRYFPPVAMYLVSLFICYSAPRPIPVLSSYSFTISVLFVISGWMCMNLLSVEDVIQAQVTLVHSRRTALVHIAKLLVAWFSGAFLGLLAVILPAILKVYGVPVGRGNLAIGMLTHITAALLGVAVGCHFSEALTKNLSNAWGGLGTLWALTFSARGLQDYISTVSFSQLTVLLHVIPPALPLADILLRWDDTGVVVKSSDIGIFAGIVVYSVTLVWLYIVRMKRRW